MSEIINEATALFDRLLGKELLDGISECHRSLDWSRRMMTLAENRRGMADNTNIYRSEDGKMFETSNGRDHKPGTIRLVEIQMNSEGFYSRKEGGESHVVSVSRLGPDNNINGRTVCDDGYVLDRVTEKDLVHDWAWEKAKYGVDTYEYARRSAKAAEADLGFRSSLLRMKDEIIKWFVEYSQNPARHVDTDCVEFARRFCPYRLETSVYSGWTVANIGGGALECDIHLILDRLQGKMDTKYFC